MSKVKAAIASMQLAFPATHDPDGYVAVMTALVRDMDESAVVETCGRFARGEVKRMDRQKGFAPSGDEFCEEVRERMAFRELMSRPVNALRLRAASRDADDMPIMHRKRALVEKYAAHKVIAEDVDFDMWKAGAKKKQWPHGAFWVAALGRVYEGKAK